MRWFNRLALIACTVQMAGCAGLIIDSIAHSSSTDKKYSEAIATLPALPSKHGRLYVYRTKESTRTSVRIGAGIQKNVILCVLDDEVIETMWSVFLYKDLHEGTHQVSCGDVAYKKGLFAGSGLKFRRGRNTLPFTISAGTDIYVRLDVQEDAEIPVLIDPDVAKHEIENLAIQNKSYGITVGGPVYVDPLSS